MAFDNTITVVGNVTRDPELAVHAGRHGRRELRRRVEQAARPDGEEEVSVLRRELLPAAWPRTWPSRLTKGSRVVVYGHAAAAQLGHARRRSPLRGRDHRRRRGAEPQVGVGRDPSSNEYRGDGGQGGGNQGGGNQFGGGGGGRSAPPGEPDPGARPPTTWTRSRSRAQQYRQNAPEPFRSSTAWARNLTKRV